MALLNKINTAKNLSFKEWVLFIQSWLMLLYIRLRMDFTPFSSWKHWLNDNTLCSSPLPENSLPKLFKRRRMIALAAKYHVINANCLPKSLSLKWQLRQLGIESQLKMGLSANANSIEGHAWLICGERVLNDSADVAERYPIEQKIDGNIVNL